MLHVVKNGYEIKPMTGFWSKVKEVGCWLGDMVMVVVQRIHANVIIIYQLHMQP